MRHSPFVLDLPAHVLAVLSLVGGDGQRRLGRVQHLADDLPIVDLSARQREVQRATLAVDTGVDFRGAAATADADRLIFLPPFAPLAARWAFTIVLSIRCKLSRDFAASWSKIRFQIPRRGQRLKRLYAVVYGPYRSGKSRHGIPVRSTQKIAFMTLRSSFLALSRLFGVRGPKRAHSASLKSNRMIHLHPR